MSESFVTADEALRARALTLHQDVQGALQHQFAESLADLQQLRQLLGDATQRLSTAFQGMIHQARAQRAAAEQLETAASPEAIQEVKALAEEITRGSVLVVQSLQFEDMARQLLEHVDRRLGWLEHYARDAHPLQTAVAGEVVGMTARELDAVEGRLRAHSQSMTTWGRKVVQQDSVDEGEIVLF